MAQAKRKEKPVEAPAVTRSPDAWEKPAGMGKRGWIILGTFLFLVQLPLIHRFLRPRADVTVTVPFQDTFSDPQALAANYWSSGGLWRIVNDQLLSPGVKNNPLWLKAELPQNVAIEFDVRSESSEGDIKVEVFGDGYDHASGYVLIHGGWNNTLSVIARLDEHGVPLTALQQRAQRIAQERQLPNSGLAETGVFKSDTRMRVEARQFPVQIGKTYRWRIERRGTLLRWFIDGQPFMELDDPFPLGGKGHDRLGFSSWEAQLFFDNLSIQPL
jgi:hypothetical protein